MFNDKILKSVAEAVKQVLATEKLHPNQQKLDVHEPEKDKLTSKDFEMLRKGKKADVKEANNPFDLKNYKSQLPTKPGEKAGFDSKKISTGTVYSRKPVKDEKPLKEEDAYDKDRYAVKDGKATKDNPSHMGSANYKDQPHHVWATSAEEALKKKSVKEGASQEDYLKEIEMAKKRAQGEGNPDLTKGKVTAVKQESVEQIDELSKDTLKSYSTKAKKDSEEYKKAGYAYDSDPDERAFAPKAFKKAASRAAGAAKADSKIKEEVEQLDELSKNLVDRYYTKAVNRHVDVLQKDLDKGVEHQKIRSLMAKTNKVGPGIRAKNPLHSNSAAQVALKAASDAIKKDREPAKKEMEKRSKGIAKAYAKLHGGKDREGKKVVRATGRLTKEDVEQIDELKKSTLASYVKKASHDVAAKGATTRQFANDSEAARKGENYPEARKKMQMADKTFAKSWKRREGMAKAVDKLAKEEVEHIDEATMTHITLGNKVKNSDGGHNQDVHYKGKKIGSIESYKHRTGLRYGGKHDASGDMEAGSRSPEEAVDFVRTAHADHLKSMKKESVEHLDERKMTEPEMKKREKIVKSMKKGMQGFKDRYGDRAKDVMYATATKQAMKD